MAKPPIQYFRREDFAEVKEPWVDKLLPKLNELARQLTYGVDGKLSVKENLSAFWWQGDIGNTKDYPGIIFPFVMNTVTLPANRITPSVSAFPFNIPNQLTPNKVNAVIVAQAKDVTVGSTAATPALLGAVAWDTVENSIRVQGINGMLAGRCYNVRLLLIGE
jgi:hypothetical protein